ncbi:MAG: CHAT domain-containing protein [Nostoc sp. DcaGUA01]|nr:CHAT domain-containing protein [Nostoc sp. DcaGUA01]
MDEQRMQAYVNLIEQLFACASREELAAILQQHAELLDAELLAVMQQYAAHLESQGNGNAAQWLLGIVEQLAKAMGITDAGAQKSSKDSEQFLWAVLQLVEQSKGDAQQVYPFLAQHQDGLNEQLLQTLPKVAASLLGGESKQQFVATVLSMFGDLIQQFPLGRRWLNVELSITAYQFALQIRTREGFPEQWATTQSNLAIAYRERILGERADNLELAIAASELALQIFTPEAFPQAWAGIQSNLAFAYSERIRGEKADNLEQAIAAGELALQIFTCETFPQQWATTQSNLALAYRERILGERADNLELAIAAYKLALQVYTHEAFPQQWAITQNNLAVAYFWRIQGDRADNLEQSIATSQLALQVLTRQAFPQDWAMTQGNLVNTYTQRIRGDRAENLEQSIAASQLALQVYTHEAFPQQWAMTQNNLANVWFRRIRGDRAENLEQSIAASQLALQVLTCEAFPQQWALAQMNLVNSYTERIRGDKQQNLEQAIAAAQFALQVFTREAFPQDWAGIQNNLANAYIERIRGDQEQNLEQAIAASQLAQQVFSRQTFPQQWAISQYNLARAYRRRIRRDKEENLEQAIAASQLALQVFTRKAFPKECLQTARNLGNLHFEQQTWAKASRAYITALRAGEILYQSAILLDSRDAELSETNGLPHLAAYALARSGDLQAAVLTLERGRARGLSEILDRDRSDLTQLQQLAPSLYTQYRDITNQRRNLESQERLRMTSDERHSLTPEALRTEALQLDKTLTKIIEQIRQVPSYEDFLAQPTFDDIRQALRPSIPLVYLVTTSAGSLALSVTQDGIDDLWLDDFIETSLQEKTSLQKLLTAWFNAYEQSQTKRSAWLEAIDQGTRQLWQPLMSPLINHLQQHNFQQATLIPTGLLSFLPLHAAWVEDSTTPTGRYYALDAIDFTYVPNARSLSTAQEIAQRTFADSILAIDEPKHDGAKPLPNSKREVQAAIATFQNSQIFTQEQATREAVLAALPHYKILHCSCHGKADLEAPLKSGLAMTGEAILTLRDLLDLKLVENNQGGIRVAILSACETGLPGIELADEAISLPTGLLQAGVAGVAASLWKVSELSTMVLLTRFYTLWRDQHLEPSQALITAQKWLRDAEPRDIVAHCETFIPELASKKGDLYRSLLLDFSHPYYWAAFSYTGV